MVSFGSTKSKSEPVQLSNWNPAQQMVFDVLAPRVKEGINQAAPSYPGDMYTPRTPEEQAYFNAVGASYSPEQLAARQSAFSTVLSGRPAYDINPETTEQLYQSGVRDPALREFNQVTLPGIKEQFAGPGYWGTARAQETSRAGENLATELAKKRAELAYEDELARRTSLTDAANRQVQGVTSPSNVVSEAVNATGTAGQYSRSIEQEKIAADFQRWLSGETVDGVVPTQYNPYLQLAFSLLGLSPYSYGNEQSSSGFSFGVNMPKEK